MSLKWNWRPKVKEGFLAIVEADAHPTILMGYLSQMMKSEGNAHEKAFGDRLDVVADEFMKMHGGGK